MTDEARKKNQDDFVAEKIDTIIAGVDQVAIDAYGATLFGMKGSDLGYVRIAAEHKFGVMDLNRLTIRKLKV